MNFTGTSLFCKVFFPAKFFSCILEKENLAGKNLLFKRVNSTLQRSFFHFTGVPKIIIVQYLVKNPYQKENNQIKKNTVGHPAKLFKTSHWSPTNPLEIKIITRLLFKGKLQSAFKQQSPDKSTVEKQHKYKNYYCRVYN